MNNSESSSTLSVERVQLEQEAQALQEEAYREILKSPLYWLRNWTATKNPHWEQEGFAGPTQPFPAYPFFPWLFEQFAGPEQVLCVKKSRDMMLSWAVVGFYTWMCQTKSGLQIPFQSQKELKAFDMVEYARELYRNQPEWLKARFPLALALDQQPKGTLRFANGSEIIGIPEGADQIRSLHPTAMMGDEVSFQPTAGESYDTAVSACQKIIEISSAASGWYEDFTERDDAESEQYIMRGVSTWRNKNGLLVVRIHYSAIPERDPLINPEWCIRERKKYSSQARWDQEQEIVASAGGGDLVLAAVLRDRRKFILIDNPDYRPSPFSRFLGCLDFGKKNPSAFMVVAIDEDGDWVFLGEHYRSGLSASEHARIMIGMRYYEAIETIWADASIFSDQQEQAEGGYRNTSELFAKGGVEKLRAAPKPKGADLEHAEWLLEEWRPESPRVRICVPPGWTCDRKREGTYDFGCPNFVWELSRLRRQEMTAVQLLTSNPTERLVQKDNHGFDASKYLRLSQPKWASVSPEEKWQRELKNINDTRAKEGRSKLDVNALAMLYKKQQAGLETPRKSWR